MINAIVEVLLHFAIPTVIVSAIFTALMMFVMPSGVRTVFKREVKSYFLSPIAYVCVVVFLLASNGLSFFFGHILEAGEASLTRAYFTFIPWCFIFIAPAVGMRLWSEEQRLGTMELLLTMPVTPWHAIVGKYLAAMVVIFAMLVLSFSVVVVMNFLGSPDNGVILAGFVASFLVGLCFLAVASTVSAFTRSQIVALLISIFICLMLFLGGWPPIANSLTTLKGAALIFWPFLKLFNALSVTPHFEELSKGILGLRDIIFFFTFIGFCLFLTAVVIRVRRA